MDLETGTRAIIALAWARRLGMADSALASVAMGTDAGRINHRDDAATTVSFVRFMGGSVLAGPQWLLRAAAGVHDEELAAESRLLGLVRAHGDVGARGLGESLLYYSDEPPTVEESTTTVVSHEPSTAVELEAICPRDDLAAARLSGLPHRFTLLSEDGHAPLAGAGYSVWEGMIADLGVLTAPSLRRHGLGTYIAAIAADDALAEGFVAQFSAEVNNKAAQLMADALGFTLAGSLTQASLDADRA
ncbi:GNAT family N-acetyltransferase [Arthrobacter sp. JSM 101049]|uniref:GNAT family N-acetyltransferase n=1 Tax=Arthrobacter sp. JSM 101049 TaxID=929097 RepID=UPI00356804A3